MSNLRAKEMRNLLLAQMPRVLAAIVEAYAEDPIEIMVDGRSYSGGESAWVAVRTTNDVPIDWTFKKPTRICHIYTDWHYGDTSVEHITLAYCTNTDTYSVTEEYVRARRMHGHLLNVPRICSYTLAKLLDHFVGHMDLLDPGPLETTSFGLTTDSLSAEHVIRTIMDDGLEFDVTRYDLARKRV
jgi:hypothetical protein